MNTPIPDDKLAQIREALFRGQKIEAIKLYRESADVGLAEAKTAVEKLETELRAASPEKFLATPRKGCLGIAVLACAIVLPLILWFVRR